MDNFNYRKFVYDQSLTKDEDTKQTLNENAPGYDTRKFGEALPTLESVKAAHEAKEDDKKEIKEEADPIQAEMKMHLKQYRDGMIDGDDLANAFEEIIYGSVTPPGYIKEDSNSIVNLLMKNQREVAKKLNYMEYFPFDEVNIDLEGDASIVLQDEAGGLSFRYPEDVDSKFVGQNGDKPRPVTIGGVDLMYIGYNI